jgi:spore maturation protein CgeB
MKRTISIGVVDRAVDGIRPSFRIHADPARLNIVILGLSITSSWGNGHATTYRGLAQELQKRGHRVTFLERDLEWYASNRDLPNPPYCQTHLYGSLAELESDFLTTIKSADVVIVGSYVLDGVAVGEWVTRSAQGVTCFYDIDTPVTLASLERGRKDYISREIIGRYDLYLSFTGGPTLKRLENEFGAQRARPLYCSVDPNLYFPETQPIRWELGYLGTYSPDRQPTLQRLLIDAARQWAAAKFVVAGPQYPSTLEWPGNVERVVHLPPIEHRAFYNRQRYTLNITRADMIKAGWSPSVRLFEAAACGTPIVSDYWDGLGSFFETGEEILIAKTGQDTLRYLREIPEDERLEISNRARKRVLAQHTAAHRALEFESYVAELRSLNTDSVAV